MYAIRSYYVIELLKLVEKRFPLRGLGRLWCSGQIVHGFRIQAAKRGLRQQNATGSVATKPTTPLEPKRRGHGWGKKESVSYNFV